MLRSTKIVATLGPASSDADVLEQMFLAGVDVVRLNFSHGSYEYHAGSIANLRGIMAGSKRACSIMLDTKGPEIRSGKVTGGSVNLKQVRFLVGADDSEDATALCHFVTFHVIRYIIGTKSVLDLGRKV